VAQLTVRSNAAPGASLEPSELDFQKFLQAIPVLIQGFWERKTSEIDETATYDPPGHLVAYHGAEDVPGCFGERSEDMIGNAYYCASLHAGDQCTSVSKNESYCLGDDIIAWDETGLMFPLYRDVGDLATALVLAHEWGHLVQARVLPHYAYR